jgi:DNA-binding CsgD family transcriptional regulator
MGRVSAHDLRRILTFLGTAPTGRPDDPVPRETLAALRDLLGADEAEYFEFRRSDRAPLALRMSDSVTEAPGTTEALAAFGWQNPIGWQRWSPTHGALRLSGQIRRRDLERLGFHGEFMAPNGLRDCLKVWLAVDHRSVACIHLWRSRRDFTQREQDVLGVVHRDLVRLRATALAADGVAAVFAPALTAREAEVLVWAVRGHSHADIARQVGASPRTVSKHLEHAYAKLDVRSRAEAVDRLLLSGPLDDEATPLS